jgi:hypothetical protein
MSVTGLSISIRTLSVFSYILFKDSVKNACINVYGMFANLRFQLTIQPLTRSEDEVTATDVRPISSSVAVSTPSTLTHHTVTRTAFNTDAASDQLVAAERLHVSTGIPAVGDLSSIRQSHLRPQAAETTIDKTPEWNRLCDELARCRQSCFHCDSDDDAVVVDGLYSVDRITFLAEVGNALRKLRQENVQLLEAVKKKDAVIMEYMQLKNKVMDAVEVHEADINNSLADIFVKTVSEYHRLYAENREISEKFRVTSAQLVQLNELNAALQEEVQRLKRNVQAMTVDERKSTDRCQTNFDVKTASDVGATRLSELIRQQVIILRQSLLRQIDECRQQQKLALELQNNESFKRKYEESLKLSTGLLENAGKVAKRTRVADVNNNEASGSEQRPKGDVSVEGKQEKDAVVHGNAVDCSSRQLVNHSQPVAAAAAAAAACDENNKRKTSTSDRHPAESRRDSQTAVAAKTTSGGKTCNHFITVNQPKQTADRVSSERQNADDRRRSATTPMTATHMQTRHVNNGGIRDKQSSTSDDEQSDRSNGGYSKKNRLRAMKTMENLADVSPDCLELDLVQNGDRRRGCHRRDDDVQRIPINGSRSKGHSSQLKADDWNTEESGDEQTMRGDKCRQQRRAAADKQHKRHHKRRRERGLRNQQVSDNDDVKKYQPEVKGYRPEVGGDRPVNCANSASDPDENHMSANGTYTFLSEDECNSTIKFKGMNGMDPQFVGNLNFLELSATANRSSDSSSSSPDDSDVAAMLQTPRSRSRETKNHVTSTRDQATTARGQQVTKTAKLGAEFDGETSPGYSGTDEGDCTSNTFTIQAADDDRVHKRISHGNVRRDTGHGKGVKKTVSELETRIAHLELSMRSVSNDRQQSKRMTAVDDQLTSNDSRREDEKQQSNLTIMKLQSQIEELRRQMTVINEQILVYLIRATTVLTNQLTSCWILENTGTESPPQKMHPCLWISGAADCCKGSTVCLKMIVIRNKKLAASHHFRIE